MRVVLIANNPNANVPSEGYDLYVHFNTTIHWGKTPDDKSIVVARVNKAVKDNQSFGWSMTGNKKIVKIPARDDQILACGWREDCNAIDPERPALLCDGVEYPNKQSPTTGYVAIHHYLENGHEVYLCGFDLKSAAYYATTKLHNPDFEIDMIDVMIGMGIIARHN